MWHTKFAILSKIFEGSIDKIQLLTFIRNERKILACERQGFIKIWDNDQFLFTIEPDEIMELDVNKVYCAESLERENDINKYLIAYGEHKS